MNTLPKELSPERCHQLREGGILRVLVNLLHEHTFELQNKPEADFSIESFLMDFNRKAELRNRSSQQIRTIVKHTAKNEDELKIFGMLKTLRSYIDRLYNFMVGWKTMTQDPSKLNECTDQLTELAGQVNEVIKELIKGLTADDTIRPIFEQFGGAFVIVDYLRAQTRFNAKCHQFESVQIDTSQLLRVANESKLVLRISVIILYKLTVPIVSSKDIRLFLGNSRSLHEIMVGIAEDAYDDGDLHSVQIYSYLLHCLYYVKHPLAPAGLWPSTSYLKDCGVINCLAKFGMEIKDPKTLYYVLEALIAPIALDRQILLEFFSIDGSVDMLIDVLVPSKEKNEDVENAKWFKGQRHYSILALYIIRRHLLTDVRMVERLLAIFESRDFAAILVRLLEMITLIDESQTTRGLLFLLRAILMHSEDQRRKFTEMVNGKNVLKRFESSDDERSARLSKQIGEMFE